MATDVTQPQARAPRASAGVIEWLRQNLFNGWLNGIVTIALLLLLIQAVSSIVRWTLTTPGWAAVASNVRLLMVGTYPPEQTWRPELVVALVALLLGMSGGVWRGIPRALAIGFGVSLVLMGLLTLTLPPDQSAKPVDTRLFLFGSAALLALGFVAALRIGERLRWPLVIAWFLLYPVAALILRGFGASLVPTNLWGGLMLTMLLSVSGIVLSFPLGVLLALGRRSNLPVVKAFCVGYIELIRGVPLVTVLFMASLMLPLFLPAGVRIDAVVRAIVAVTLFSAAYLAENVRGGLQALPRGQTEAARALGLSSVQTTLLITLPQALRAVIPVLVGQFISLFKDTSLVVIIGLTDLLGAARSIYTQPEWLGIPGGVWRETLLFCALIYWVFSFTMSRTARTVEMNLNVGKH